MDTNALILKELKTLSLRNDRNGETKAQSLDVMRSPLASSTTRRSHDETEMELSI